MKGTRKNGKNIVEAHNAIPSSIGAKESYEIQKGFSDEENDGTKRLLHVTSIQKL